MAVFDTTLDLYERTLSCIDDWEPEKEYSRETDYRDDLINYLRDNLTKRTAVLNISGEAEERVKIIPESGRGLCDIGIEKEVGIELKRNLNSTSRVDRLMGQLQRFLGEYSTGVIVLLVGKTGGKAYEQVLDGVKGMDLGGGFGEEPQKVEVVNKG